MTAADTFVLRIHTETTTATDDPADAAAAALLDELARKMREAAAEVRPASFDIVGAEITAVWDEAT